VFNERMKKKPITIDEHCGQPQGSFKKFLKEKEDFLKKLEEDRKTRIRAARKNK